MSEKVDPDVEQKYLAMIDYDTSIISVARKCIEEMAHLLRLAEIGIPKTYEEWETITRDRHIIHNAMIDHLNKFDQKAFDAHMAKWFEGEERILLPWDRTKGAC